MIVLDTNVLSETFKPQPAMAVLRWLAFQDPMELFTTAVTQAEILFGIELLPTGKRRAQLSTAADAIFAEDFRDRIIPFDQHAARIFAKIASERKRIGRPISQSDAMIAAISRAHGAAVATRNTSDFEQCGLRLIDPFSVTAAAP